MKISFGTDGFRGVIGKDFTFNRALKVVQKALAYFKSYGSKDLAIGFDTRFLSPEVAEEAAQFAKDVGFHVYLSENFCPTPFLSMFVNKKNLGFGIMVTASHNPPIYNGIKIKESFGGSALLNTIQEIARMGCIRKGKEKGVISKTSFEKVYFDTLKKFINFKELKINMKVLIDPMYGSGMGWMKNFLKKTAIEITEIHNQRNPSFMNIQPEPLLENLTETRQMLLKGKFDLAFIFDGDADRIASLDSEGNFYSTQKLLPIFLNFLVRGKKLKGTVVKTVSSTSILDKMAKKHNLKIAEVPIGFKNIVPYFLNNSAILGGEESGGMAIKGYIPERDGIFSAIYLLQILNYYNKSLLELWQEIEDEYGKAIFKREDLRFEERKDIREKITSLDFDYVLNFKVKKKTFLDGKKFIFDNGFLLIRLSGTEPVLRIYVEGNKQEMVDDVILWCKKKLKEIGFSILR